MKKILLFLFAISLLNACKSDEGNKESLIELEKLNKENQELKNQLQNKDGEINSFMQSFNDIQQNLDAIKEREKMVKENTASVELQKTKQDIIAEDINKLSELLSDNKSKLASLRRKLNKSNVKIGELQAYISKMENDLKAKDEELGLLKEELERSNNAYKDLFVEYVAKVEEVEETKEELSTVTQKMNRAWFAFGTSKELKEKNVISKEGGVAGLGKVSMLKSDFNKDYFTQIDLTQTSEIPLKCKKATVITTHPSGSYKIEGVKGAIDKITILSPEEFWGASKYLVVVIE